MREDCGNLEAARALDIQEVAVRRLNESLEFVNRLLVFCGGVK
jgi:hypothetical protein